MGSRPPIRVVDLAGAPEAVGERHGAMFAEEIRAYAADRLALVMGGAWSGGAVLDLGAVLALAEACVPHHETHSATLYAELCGLARGAGISLAEAVIVGGFTDFVDVVRAAHGEEAPEGVAEDDCTAFLVPAARAGGRALFGQTWDMHETATDHVVVLRITPEDAPAALVFTTTGCLGQLGMNEAGVCVGINNLTGTDGRPGVTWPSVVRAMLQTTTAADALAVLLAAPLAGAHSYLVLDATGTGYCVEAMPTARPVTTLADRAVVHTNHTTTAVAFARQAARPADLLASSVARLQTAAQHLDRDDLDVEDLMALTRIPEVICLQPSAPYHLETSGGVIMRPADRSLWAVWGPPTDNDYTSISFP